MYYSLPTPTGIFNAKTLRWEFINPAFEELTGYTSEEILASDAKKQTAFIHPAHTQSFNELLLKLINQEPIKSDLPSIKLKKKGGVYFWAKHQIRPLKSDNKNCLSNVNLYVVSFIDLSSHLNEVYTIEKTQDQLHRKRLVKAKLEHLTQREMQILFSIGEGLTNKDIAERFFISVETVKTHRKNLLAKLSFGSTREIIKFCILNEDIIEELSF
jgi:PAS domain S-box-containing protein